MTAANKYRRPAIVSPMAERCGIWIAHLRRKHGWTIRYLAQQIELSKGHLCDVENGRRRISAEYLHRIANALQVPLDLFFQPFEPDEIQHGRSLAP